MDLAVCWRCTGNISADPLRHRSGWRLLEIAALPPVVSLISKAKFRRPPEQCVDFFIGNCVIIISNGEDTNMLVPIVVEQTNRGERAYDIYSRLLKGG